MSTRALSDYDIDPEAFNLRDALDKVLEVLVSVYESHGVPLPTRRYWTMGEPAVECEQAVVSFINLYLGAPGDEAAVPQRCNALRSMVVTIEIARPVPTGSKSGAAPTPEQIQGAAEWAAVDAWVLIDSMEQFDNWGGLARGPGVIATVDTPAPQGGFQTVRMQLTVAVP